MRPVRVRVAMLALAAALVACTPRQSAPTHALTGVWQTGCAPVGENGRHGFVTTLELHDGWIDATSQLYARATCDTPTIRAHYRGRITALRDEAGTIDLDHRVHRIDMTLQAADVVDAYNRPGSGCGFGEGWKLGVARPIAGRICAPFAFPAAGTRLYERLWIEGAELRPGNIPFTWTNTAPVLRPATPGTQRFRRIR